MAMKVAVVFAALCAISYGAVVPMQEDALYDMIQSFLVQPDQFAEAMGAVRVKRDAYDKAFNFNALGVEVGIDYLDPNNQLKGGKLDVKIDNLKRLIPRAKSEKVVLAVNFNGGDSARDGLFSMSIDYELNHANQEKGTFNMERKKVGNKWVSKMAVKSKNNPSVKIIPVFALNMESDRKTFAQGTYNSERYGDYTIDVKRVPGQKIDAVIEGNGKKYIVAGKMDKASKKITIDIDANGLKYDVVLDAAGTTGDKVAFKGTVNIGGSGKYEVNVNGKKDMTDLGFDVLFNGNPLASAKVKGSLNMAQKSGKYEVRYSSVGLGEGKVRVGYKGGDKKEFKFQYLPKAAKDLKLVITRDKKADGSIQWDGLVTRNDETYLKYNNHVIPKVTGSSYELEADSNFHVSDKSVLYPMFCKYGCFNDRAMKAKVYVDKAKPYKLSVDVELFKDSVSVLTMEINSRQNPYKFKIFAPRILPKILPTGRESIEFSADHKPGSYIKVTSNTNMIKNFAVEKIAGTNTRKITLNDKELVQGGYTQKDNEITSTITLPNGKALTTTLKWKNDNMKANDVEIKLDGTERKLDLELEWNFNNPADMSFKIDADGWNKKIGDYHFKRDGKVSASSNKLTAKWTGSSNFANAPWPQPVETMFDATLDNSAQNYKLKMSKTAAGKKFNFSFDNGRFSIDF